MTRAQMTQRILIRSLRLRRGRTLIAFIALTLAATLISAMLALYSDLESKLDKEFRSYGANIVVAANSGHTLPAGAEQRVSQLLGGNALVVPSGMVIARMGDNKDPIVVVGIDMDAAKRLNRWWSVSQWPGGEDQALIGVRARPSLANAADLNLIFNGIARRFHAAGTIETGGPEDSRIFIPLSAYERWTGLAPSILEIAYTGSSAQIQGALDELKGLLAGEAVEVRPVRKIVEAEGHVIRKTRAMMFACALLIALTVVLCVMSTLTSSVLERRRDFALMKALGASQILLNSIFAAEALALAVAAALLGFLLGSALADLIGEVNFHASIVPTATVFPSVLALTLLVALASALLPLARLRHIEPAAILKGE